MTSTLVDSNVILDLLNRHAAWFNWSSARMEEGRNEGRLVINQIIYAETSAQFGSRVEFSKALGLMGIDTEHLPWEGAFAAGQAHLLYRQGGGLRERTLPDFLVGSHAAFSSYRLLTRDARRYRTSFPALDIIAPDSHP